MLVILYFELQGINFVQQVHELVRIHLRSISDQQILLDAFGFQLALQGRKCLLVPTELVASCRESKGRVSHPRLSHVFPSAEHLASAQSIDLRIPRARRSSLQALAEAAARDSNLFRPFGTIEEAIARLRTIRGVGEWTAQYIALRALREMDAFPATDIGLLRGAALAGGTRSTSASLLDRAESWRPWRAYAAQHLWAADSQVISNTGGAHG